MTELRKVLREGLMPSCWLSALGDSRSLHAPPPPSTPCVGGVQRWCLAEPQSVASPLAPNCSKLPMTFLLTAYVCHQHAELQLCAQPRQALDHALHGTHEAHPHGVHQHATAQTPADPHVCGRLHGDGRPCPLPQPENLSQRAKHYVGLGKGAWRDPEEASDA